MCRCADYRRASPRQAQRAEGAAVTVRAPPARLPPLAARSKATACPPQRRDFEQLALKLQAIPLFTQAPRLSHASATGLNDLQSPADCNADETLTGSGTLLCRRSSRRSWPPCTTCGIRTPSSFSASGRRCGAVFATHLLRLSIGRQPWHVSARLQALAFSGFVPRVPARPSSLGLETRDSHSRTRRRRSARKIRRTANTPYGCLWRAQHSSDSPEPHVSVSVRESAMPGR